MSWLKSTEKVKKTGRTIIIRAKVTVIVITALLCFLIGRLVSLQLVDAGNYKNQALEQYTHDLTISAKRGSILDRNQKPLAVSATVYNVFIAPKNIEDDKQLELIADGLSRILNVDKQSIIQKCTDKRKSLYQVIKKKISDSEEALVRAFIKENNLSKTGIINLEETTKRYYPYNTLASQIIGFTGTDNNGLAGIEKAYDEYLKGVDGRSIKGRDANGNALPFKYENYEEAQNGYNLITTIDYNVQSILEKYLKQAYIDDNPQGAVSGMIMDVKTGEILASAIYPDFDLNNYNVLTDYYQNKLEEFSKPDEETGETKTEAEIEAEKSKLLYQMWDNALVTKTYEPGSTFKIITSAMALESGLVKESDHFFCPGFKIVGGQRISCHQKGGHKDQDFALALRQSCNPAFMEIGLRVGNETFMKYFDAFGYLKKSQTDLLGEAETIYWKTYNNQFKDVELAVYSFGQTFAVTPLQHLRAVATIANGGDLVTPHVGKALVDNNGNIVKTFEFPVERQVISKNTSDIISKALINSSPNACVNGYDIVIKTGTSEKRNTIDIEDDYVGSTVAFAPAEDPQIAIVILVDTPPGSRYYGSIVAAPYVSKTLAEVLPYLGIEPTSGNTKTVLLKNYIGSDSESAKTVIEKAGLKCVIKGSGGAVTDQIPKEGTSVAENGLVILYTAGEPVENTVKVPNVVGNGRTSPSTVNTMITNSNLNISLKGIHEGNFTNCYAVSQSPAAGEMVPPGTVITVEFRYDEQRNG
jgi:stage V sporulation protein D (sporulation-specific penicillin-binding protein)